MPIIGTPRSYFNKFKFLAEFDGLTYAGFKSCSELSAELATIEHFEGGVLIPNKTPGRLTFADITLERGATLDLETYNWFEQGAKASAGTGGIGLKDNRYKRNGEIIQLDRDDTVLQRWSIKGAWVKKFVAGDWDNDSDEKVITSMTLAFDFFEPKNRGRVRPLGF